LHARFPTEVERGFAEIIVIEKVGATLPFGCEQVFDLAADIERYPEFLPWWISAHIRKRESDIYHVEQVMGMGPIRLQFESRAVLHRPQRIDITSTDGAFRKFDISCVVAATSSMSCCITIAAELELQSAFLQQVVNRLLPTAIEEIVRAFDARAHALSSVPHG
jgi:coenzyme Q-binding protein COQ10